MGMADDLLKIRTKRFWGQRILGGVHKAQVERRRGGEGLNHRQQSVGLFWLSILSNSCKRRQ